jgi:transposase-like protein
MLHGLEKVWLAVSGAHKGLVASKRETFVGTILQWYKIHFMRNNLTHISATKRNLLQPSSKHMVQPDEEAARAYANLLMD